MNRAEQIARTMASLGYVPKGVVDARYVEYYKDYAEPHGRIARCTVLFDKGGVFAGIDQARLSSFVVTVQGVIDPLDEEIKTKTPRVMQPDMLHVLSELGRAERPVAVVRAVDCAKCGTSVAEWVETVDGSVCPECVGL